MLGKYYKRNPDKAETPERLQKIVSKKNYKNNNKTKKRNFDPLARGAVTKALQNWERVLCVQEGYYRYCRKTPFMLANITI